MIKRTLFDAFADAADGILYSFLHQPNFRIQLGIGLLAVAAGIWLRFGLGQWLVLVITIGIVLAAELFNTCLEHVVDLIQPDTHPLARSAKHAGAAAVLVASVAATVVGLILYGQALGHWLRLRG
jgi:diacylglycerol kinase